MGWWRINSESASRLPSETPYLFKDHNRALIHEMARSKANEAFTWSLQLVGNDGTQRTASPKGLCAYFRQHLCKDLFILTSRQDLQT